TAARRPAPGSSVLTRMTETLPPRSRPSNEPPARGGAVPLSLIAAPPVPASDVDAVVAGDAGQARGVALADGAELPLRAAPVELAEHQRRLGGGVLAEVEAGELAPVALVDDPDVGVDDLAEALPAGVGVVDAHREDDLVDLGGHRRQVDLDHLVVALA